MSVRRLRIVELEADPANRKYAAMMRRGSCWTDARIAYAGIRDVSVLCPHLKPVERAMRRAGIVTHMLTESYDKNFASLPSIAAHCRVNWIEVQRGFVLAASVRYEEGYQPERHERDNPWVRLVCGHCRSSIDVVHPERPGAGIPWFPVEAEHSA